MDRECGNPLLSQTTLYAAADSSVNVLQPQAKPDGERSILFQANDRIILNYYAAKRLAIALGQIVKRYESEYGEVELNSANRRKGQKS